MNLLIILLSIILVLNAAFLVLLILIQLPKKEAGAGLAFGAGATDALFGAGSGNALTKMTKYTATFFLGLVLVLSFLSQKSANEGSRRLASELQKRANAPAPVPLPIPSTTGTNASSGTNGAAMRAVSTNAAKPAAAPLNQATPPANATTPQGNVPASPNAPKPGK